MKVYILLDRSGSMSTRWSEALGSINTYVEELTKAKDTKKAVVTLATFDSSATTQFDVIRDKVAAKGWNKVTDADAVPRGGTPLFDAIGKLMTLAEGDKPEKASIIIMTDGHENSSREMSRDAAKSTLDRARGKGWPVIFMGADFDAMSQASSVGTQFAQTLNASAGNYASATKAMAAMTADYASTGLTRAFTAQERASASGKSAA